MLVVYTVEQDWKLLWWWVMNCSARCKFGYCLPASYQPKSMVVSSWLVWSSYTTLCAGRWHPLLYMNSSPTNGTRYIDSECDLCHLDLECYDPRFILQALWAVTTQQWHSVNNCMHTCWYLHWISVSTGSRLRGGNSILPLCCLCGVSEGSPPQCFTSR